jgi:hypothetical protein
MNSDNHNVDYRSNASLLKEADEIARRWNYTRDFALYVMYRQAITAGDNARAATCMDLLEKEVMTALVSPVFLDADKENDKSGETKSHSP